MRNLLCILFLLALVKRDLAVSLSEIAKRFLQLEHKIFNLELSNKHLTSSNSHLKSRLESLESSKKILESSNKKLESSNKNLVSSNTKLVVKNNKLSREINVLRTNITLLTSSICTLGGNAQINQQYCPHPPLASKRDCSALYKAGIKKNGIYNVTMGGTKTMEVYCDQTTDGGGWTVIQRRVDGKLDFHRNWSDYKTGFGDNKKELYLGNEKIHLLSNQGNKKGSELRIDMNDWEGNSAYAKYSSFKLDNENMKYKLYVTGYSGNAGDSLHVHDGSQFSTYDQDNDDRFTGSCAKKYLGGWWYTNCFNANLNGEYLTHKQPQPAHARGVIWNNWKGVKYSLRFVEMKVRRKI